MTNRQARSDKYQYLLREVPVDFPSFPNTFSTDRGLGYGESFSEEFLDLNEEAIEILKELIQLTLTRTQLAVFELAMAGYTQTEIAKQLDLCQSSVNKTLTGAHNYQYAGAKHGGIFKKIRNAILRSEKMQSVLLRMMELTND